MSNVLTQSPPTQTTRLIGGESLVDQFTTLIADPAQRHAATNVLRALTRPLLRAISTMRHESIEPYERALGFASQILSADIASAAESLTDEPLYLLGRIDALLDLCDMAIDRSISTAVVQQAGAKKHVPEILARLADAGDTRPSELAAEVAISPQHLSNLLTWMEVNDLVRRAAAGRATFVSLGPKGEAVYRALHMPGDIPQPIIQWATPRQNRVLGKILLTEQNASPRPPEADASGGRVKARAHKLTADG